MRRYNGDDMDKMQQEAVRRMQEMQNRGKPLPPPPEKNPEPPSVMPLPPPIHDKIEKPNYHQDKPPEVKHTKSFFDTLFQDKERSLILLLILILSSEKNDMGLIFALIYLLI